MSRQSYRTYREGRTLPVEVYDTFFEFYSERLNPVVPEGDVYPGGPENPAPVAENVTAREIEHYLEGSSALRFDLALNGSYDRLKQMQGFGETRDLIIEE